MSEFDLKAAREWVDMHPTATSVNVNAYVAALDEISRLRPVYEAAKVMQSNIGEWDRIHFKRVNAVCAAVEVAEANTDKRGRGAFAVTVLDVERAR